MKKVLAVVLAVMMTALCAISLASCEKNDGNSDLAYIKNKGVLIVGITEYEPMNYLDENGKWTGFDT